MIERISAIVKAIKLNTESELATETDLIIDIGFDSVNMLELVTSLEDSFSITFKDEDLDLDNFRTMGMIEKTIGRYNGAN